VASLGHVVVGVVAARLYARGRGATAFSSRSAVAFAGLSLLPDLDVVAFAAGIPYGAPFGHRGASHALAVAMAIGVVAALLGPRLGLSRLRTGVFVAVVVGSHGILDAMTDGGKGVSLLWPLTTERFFLPWRPIPVAPIGGGIVSARGLDVMLTELVYFAPLLLWALWPRRRAGDTLPSEPADPDEGDLPSPDAVVVAPIEDAIDLHTFAPRDVESVVGEYLREARRRGLPEVRVIHGKGKGVQRRIVLGVLERHPDVASFRDAPASRGGWGATIVELRVRDIPAPSR